MDGSAPLSPSPWRELARDLFRELIETDTTHASGSTTAAAEAMAARLRGAGPRGPLLLLAHLDVVDAVREEWTVDPFTFLERDGHFYGRGTTDDKAIRRKRSGM